MVREVLVAMEEGFLVAVMGDGLVAMVIGGSVAVVRGLLTRVSRWHHWWFLRRRVPMLG